MSFTFLSYSILIIGFKNLIIIVITIMNLERSTTDIMMDDILSSIVVDIHIIITIASTQEIVY